jgi:hypothetical protein
MDVNHPLALIESQEIVGSFVDNAPKVSKKSFDNTMEKELFNLSILKYVAIRAIHSIPSESVQRHVFRAILILRNLLKKLLSK